MANRKRNIQMKFYVTEDEKRLIDEKMSQLISMEVFPMMTPALLFTTLCPTSKIPMTMFHVFVTMRTAQKVLKIHLKNIQVSTSCRLFFSVTSWISS